jgi:hypothetical protein
MGKLVSVILYLLPVGFLWSQDPCNSLNYHAFKAESVAGTYTDLDTLGEEISVSNLDDGISQPLAIGFEFVYHCQSFNRFVFNTNGFIKLGTETNPSPSLFFSNAQSTSGGLFSNPDSNNVNLIAVFDHDIEVADGIPDFRYYTSGTAPNRVCTIQWKNMREWSADPLTKQYIDINFQLKLYETTNVIEFVYGDWGPSANASNYKTAACGLKGASNADDQLLVVVKSSAAHWDNVTFHNGNYAPNESFNFGNPPDRPEPDAGRTYRFTPTYYHDLSVEEVYALGQASSYYSSPQTIAATIQNRGYYTQSDIPVILEITGANTYSDTQYVSQMEFTENMLVTFPGYSPAVNGQSSIKVYVGDDDGRGDNSMTTTQQVTDVELNYASPQPPSRGYGFLSGVQGIYYTKYPVHGTATISAVNVFVADDSVSIGKTIFGAVLNESGQLVARSDNYVIQESDLGGWHTFVFPNAPVLSNTSFFAGMGMVSSPLRYSALGVQDEYPVRPGTYYTSLITGNGLKEMDPANFAYRFMIGVTLTGTQPQAGPATGDTTICAFGTATISLQDFTGFITWQSSPDGISGWQTVLQDEGSPPASYTTPPLTSSTYYRAAVFQPGFGFAFSNVVFIEVIPSTPVVTASGDALQSSSESGNQWYDENGLIPGATGQNYLALTPGTYYVIVTSGECTSAPSNLIELITVATHQVQEDSGFSIYPNPAADELNIILEGNTEKLLFDIVNSAGQTVQTGLLQESAKLAITNLNSGLYFIVIHSMPDRKVKWFVKT